MKFLKRCLAPLSLFLFLLCAAPPSHAQTSQIPQQCKDTSGSATTQVCSTTLTLGPVKGDEIIYSTTTTNTGDLTVNVDGTGAAHIKKWSGSATLAAGDIVANTPVELIFDGAGFWEVQTIGNAPGAGSVTTSGSPASGYCTYFSGTTVIIGTANCTLNSSGNMVLAGTLTAGPSVATTSDGVHAAYFYAVGNTTLPVSLPSNAFGIIGPNSASFTSYFLQPSATAPSGTQAFECGTPSSNVSACTWATISGGSGNPAIIANDTTTGTIVNELAEWNAGSTGAIVPTAAVQGSTGNAFIGVVTAGAGTTGNATIVTAGYAQCLSDNAATLGHWAVQGSTGVFGKCHDSGTAFTGTPPAYAIGVFTTTGAAGLQGIILRADASSFLGTLRTYGILADGPGVFNAALSYDNNNSGFTAGWQIGGNTAYGAITGGPAGPSMLRGQITITNPATTGVYTFPLSSGGQAYTNAPVCVVAADTTSAIFAVTGAPWVDSVATTNLQLQVDVAVTPAATIKVNYVCVGFPN